MEPGIPQAGIAEKHFRHVGFCCEYLVPSWYLFLFLIKKKHSSDARWQKRVYSKATKISILAFLRNSKSSIFNPCVPGSKLSLFPYNIGDGHQPNSRGLYTN